MLTWAVVCRDLRDNRSELVQNGGCPNAVRRQRIRTHSHGVASMAHVPRFSFRAVGREFVESWHHGVASLEPHFNRYLSDEAVDVLSLTISGAGPVLSVFRQPGMCTVREVVTELGKSPIPSNFSSLGALPLNGAW